MHILRLKWFGALVTFGCLVGEGYGSLIPVPPGLNPGDTYQLAFISSTARDGISTQILDYNNFVQGVANAAGIGTSAGVTWYAIASTAAANANANAVVTSPVYNMNLDLVATGYADLWDGSLLAVGISYDEHGSENQNGAWTGSQSNGLGFAGRTMGTAFPELGDSSFTDPNWISLGALNKTAPLCFYALSSQLTVVPEPASLSLLLFGAAFVARCTFRRRQQRVT